MTSRTPQYACRQRDVNISAIGRILSHLSGNVGVHGVFAHAVFSLGQCFIVCIHARELENSINIQNMMPTSLPWPISVTKVLNASFGHPCSKRSLIWGVRGGYEVHGFSNTRHLQKVVLEVLLSLQKGDDEFARSMTSSRGRAVH